MGYIIGLFKEDNYYEWDKTLLRANDSLYAVGLFHLKILFPQQYPDKKPEIIFLTPIYHLNVNPRKNKYFGDELLGHVCLSITNFWNPKTTVRQMLTQLYSMFYWHHLTVLLA